MLAALILVIILCSSTRAQISMRANVTVAKDGSGHFTTISAAIEAAPKMSATKFYVAIRAGVYTENVFIGQDKQNIVLIGDGMDTTIISGNRSNATGFRTFETATVGQLKDKYH